MYDFSPQLRNEKLYVDHFTGTYPHASSDMVKFVQRKLGSTYDLWRVPIAKGPGVDPLPVWCVIEWIPARKKFPGKPVADYGLTNYPAVRCPMWNIENVKPSELTWGLLESIFRIDNENASQQAINHYDKGQEQAEKDGARLHVDAASMSVTAPERYFIKYRKNQSNLSADMTRRRFS